MKKYKIVRYKKKTLYSELEVVYSDQWPSWPRPRRLQCANQTRYPSFYIIPVAGTLSPPAGHYGNCSENGRRWTLHSSTRRNLDEFHCSPLTHLCNGESLAWGHWSGVRPWVHPNSHPTYCSVLNSMHSACTMHTTCHFLHTAPGKIQYILHSMYYFDILYRMVVCEFGRTQCVV